MGAVEQYSDGRATLLKAPSDVGLNVGPLGNIGVVNALPRQGRGGLVAVVSAEVSVAEKQEQVLEVLHSALHQVGEDGLHLGHRSGAGGDQVLVPLLVPGAGDEGDALAAAVPDQRIEAVGHCSLAAQQAQDDHARSGGAGEDLIALGIAAVARTPGQGRRIDGVHPRKIPGQRRQRPVGGENVGVGSGDEKDGFLLHKSVGRSGYPPWFPGVVPLMNTIMDRSLKSSDISLHPFNSPAQHCSSSKVRRW